MTNPVDDTVELPLSADRDAAKRARAFIRERWSALDESALDDATLIVSELVTNAVQHGQPDIVLRIRVQPFAIDIAVLDHGPGLPPAEPPPADPMAASGRGLSIVGTLAREWGIEPLHDATGKTVWATLGYG